MNTIKFLQDKRIKINGEVYKPYTICDLPSSFGESEKFDIKGGNALIVPKIDHWLKLPSPNQGLTYIKE